MKTTRTNKDTEAARVKRQLEQTAAQRYADHRRDVAVLMDCIQMELDHHAARAAEKPDDWGYAGDLGRVRESMKDILRSLLIGRYEWSETEASCFIEDHLESMRCE